MATDQTHYDPGKFVLLKDPEVLDLGYRKHRTFAGIPVPIHLPVAALRGHYEKLTDQELEDLTSDLLAEGQRRNNLRRAKRALDHDQGGGFNA